MPVAGSKRVATGVLKVPSGSLNPSVPGWASPESVRKPPSGVPVTFGNDCINTLATDPVDGCINSYEGQQAAELDDYSNAFTNVKNDAAAAFEYEVNSAYIQDTWDVNDQLTVQYGIRYDWYTADDTPALNPRGLGDAALYDRESAQPRYSGDPAFPNPIRYIADSGLAGGVNLQIKGQKFVNTLWQINVQGQSPDGSTTRIEVVETKTLASGY